MKQLPARRFLPFHVCIVCVTILCFGMGVSLAQTPCVTVTADQSVGAKFIRHTVAGLKTPLPELPDPDPTDPEGFIGASFLTVGDLDDDGVKEILCSSGIGADGMADTSDGSIGLFTWDGSDLDSWMKSIIFDQFIFPNELELHDMDGDGDLDIVVQDKFFYGTDNGGVYYLENLAMDPGGDGDITNPLNWVKRTIYVGIDGKSYHRSYFLDLDGDGLEDVITSHMGGITLWVKNLGGGVYSSANEIGAGGGSLFAMLDVDDDGDLDIVTTQLFITIGFPNIVAPSPDGDSLLWFENPGQTALAADPTQAWNRYTIDHWDSSANPIGKGFEVITSDIDNDNVVELVVTNHNHQMYDTQNPASRIWPSGVFYLEIPGLDLNPGDPKVTADWLPVTIEIGDPNLDPDDRNAVLDDVFGAERRGGCCYWDQGSPGMVRSDDINNDSLTDVIVAGDGKGALYYYEAQAGGGSCLEFTRAALFDFPESMPAEAQINDIDNDGDLDIIASSWDTSVLHPPPPDYTSASIFVFENEPAFVCPQISVVCDSGASQATTTQDDCDSDGYTAYTCPTGEDCISGNCGDCNDLVSTLNPGQTEVCVDQIDNDCDGARDCDDGDCSSDVACGGCVQVSVTCTTNPGEASETVTITDQDDCDEDTYAAYSCPAGEECTSGNCGDCDDAAAAINPGATEVCNDAADNDCDSSTDCDDSDCAADPICACTQVSVDCYSSASQATVTTSQDDCDGDAYTAYTCPAGEDCTSGNCGDCNDAAATAYPGAPELCDDPVDNDCDGFNNCEDSDCDEDPACVPILISLSSFTASAQSGAIVLAWTTESEIDNAGFNIYRAEAADGEYVKINSTLIAAEGTPSKGAAYSFTDSGVRNRTTYYYKLEDVDLNGTTTSHGPVSATPRLLLQ